MLLGEYDRLAVGDFRVLFVCYGNTCRSPLAEGVFRSKVEREGLGDRIDVDSAGTNPPSEGGAPHGLSCAVARRNDIDIDHLRSRRFATGDFDRFDRIVVMDAMNMRDVVARARSERDRTKVGLLRGADDDVEDPIFGGEEEYERAFAEIDKACEQLLGEVRAELGGRP
jgi:protein-tyrosine phosphatase